MHEQSCESKLNWQLQLKALTTNFNSVIYWWIENTKHINKLVHTHVSTLLSVCHRVWIWREMQNVMCCETTELKHRFACWNKWTADVSRVSRQKNLHTSLHLLEDKYLTYYQTDFHILSFCIHLQKMSKKYFKYFTFSNIYF